MNVDVSEIKTYRTCRRQWQLSSRNRFHMRPKVSPPAFALGTLFHEALHQLYLEVPLEKVMQMIRKEMQTDSDAALLAMVPGYAKHVLPGDLDRFKVLDIEHHFEFVPCTSDGAVLDPDITVVGSIDMIVLDIAANKIYGFEHKTAKNFRDPAYLWMDEQPRVYTYALQQYVARYNEIKRSEWLAQCEAIDACDVSGSGGATYPEEPSEATLGGIYINEVKKLLRDFKYQRTLCQYPEGDLDNFMQAFFGSCLACKHSVDNNDPAIPNPSYFGCSGCMFKTVCETYMYSTLQEQKVLEEFQEEFVKRTEDHLDEKIERTTED